MSPPAVIDELLTATIVAIDQARCLNNRHARAGCSRCREVCPTDAVVFDGHLPVVVTDDCVRCGACAPVCPTDAVTVSTAAERRLIENCEQLPGDVVTLVCSEHPRPRPTQSRTPVVRHARCLASLHIEQLIALTRNGTRRVHLDLNWCQHCPLTRAADTIVSNADAATALVALRSHASTTIVTLENLPSAATSVDTEATPDSWVPAISRRGLFRSIQARTVAAAVPTSIATPVRRTGGPVAQRLPQYVPLSRRRLLERLDDITATDAPDIPVADQLAVPAALVPIADVRVDRDRCSGCALCDRYCPTGAIAFTTGAETADGRTPFALTVDTSICLACDICAHACPEDAVTFGDKIDGTKIDHERRLLVSGQLIACDACGLPTAVSSGTCFSCRHGTGVVSALRDDAGLMADFLARSPRGRHDEQACEPPRPMGEVGEAPPASRLQPPSALSSPGCDRVGNVARASDPGSFRGVVERLG